MLTHKTTVEETAMLSTALIFEEEFPEAFKEIEARIKAGGETGTELIKYIRSVVPMLDVSGAIKVRNALLKVFLA